MTTTTRPGAVGPVTTTITDDAVAIGEFRAIGTRCRVLVTDPRALDTAIAEATAYLTRLDAAASRFRPDSEVNRLAADCADGPITTSVSRLLADCLDAALQAAELTGGLVIPTLGSALAAAGYDDDLDIVRARSVTAMSQGSSSRAMSSTLSSAGSGGGLGAGSGAGSSMRGFAFDAATRVVTLPRGTVLDLGATAKALAAQRICEVIRALTSTGVLVDLGGDIAIAGPVPTGGWRIGVQDETGAEVQVVALSSGGIATSSTQLRTWRAPDGSPRHHVIDPRTGTSADAVWAQVTCVARSTVIANASSTAALILGLEAPRWLEERGIPARLHPRRHTTTDGAALDTLSPVFTAGWPQEA